MNHLERVVDLIIQNFGEEYYIILKQIIKGIFYSINVFITIQFLIILDRAD